MTSYATLQLLAAIAAASNIPPTSTIAAPSVVLPVAKSDKRHGSSQIMPWDKEGWVPRMPNGEPKTAAQVRNQLQKYIESSGKTKTYIINHELQVNSNSFRRFMNPDTYKNQWSATQNGTYWAAAKLLERQALAQQKGIISPALGLDTTTTTTAKKVTPSKKRHSDASDGPPKKLRKPTKVASQGMESYMLKVQAVSLPEDCYVFDSCPQVIEKIKEFLKREGVSKASFCRTLGDLNHNSLNRFLTTKNQDGAGMVAYERAYRFFERMRLLEAKPKSQARIQNELLHANGFSVKTPSRGSYQIFVRNR